MAVSLLGGSIPPFYGENWHEDYDVLYSCFVAVP